MSKLDELRLLEDAQAVAQMGAWSVDGGPEAPIAWTKECARIYGRSRSDAPSIRGLLEMSHPDDRANVIDAYETARDRQEPFEMEHRIVRPDGETRWIFARAVARGEVAPPERGLSVVGIVQDVTARRTRERRGASEDHFRRIVENTSEGVWVYDAEGITTFMNARMAQMLGCTVEEAVGKPVYAFMDDSVLAEARARVARRRQGIAEQGEFRLRRQDGSELWVSSNADPIMNASGEVESVIVFLSDITERRRSSDARNLLAAIVEGSDDSIIGATLDGRITFANHGAEVLFGYPIAELTGRNVADLIPEDRQGEERRVIERVTRGEPVRHFETVRRRKDGSRVHVSLSVSVIRDVLGNIVGVSKIARDISARRAAEAVLHRTEEQLRHAQKMEAVGVLAGGVAHDFNNLLSVILSYATLLLDAASPTDPMRSDLEEIRQAGLRATSLTRQLLAFSRKQILAPVVLDVNQIVLGVEKMVSRLLGEDIDFAVVAAATAPNVHADPGQIEQVIMNLVVNARDAMPTGGNLTVETANVTLDEAYASAHVGVVPGPYVRIAVTDTGIGMDEATKARIFEPFFTTKDKSRGTGLGLSTVYGIVKQSGGHIWVYSELGQGTAFKVYLPCTDRLPDGAARPPAVTSLSGTETVLVVEDDATVRQVVCSVLRRNGYHILEAQNGGEAFLLCEQFTARIHLLLTDVVMPRMSGKQLADRLSHLRPEMKVLFVSGYTENTIVHHGILDAGVHYLAKPILPDSLLRKVRQVLDS